MLLLKNMKKISKIYSSGALIQVDEPKIYVTSVSQIDPTHWKNKDYPTLNQRSFNFMTLFERCCIASTVSSSNVQNLRKSRKEARSLNVFSQFRK